MRIDFLDKCLLGTLGQLVEYSKSLYLPLTVEHYDITQTL